MESPASTKRFRIAFSFAGGKRDFVKVIAALLTARLGPNKIYTTNFARLIFQDQQ
jgi:hypothetical protein